MKIPDSVIIAELQAEKRRWEIERKALRAKVEELYAKVVRAENEVRTDALKEINRDALKEARKDLLYKELSKVNNNLHKRNRELTNVNKNLVTELAKYKSYDARHRTLQQRGLPRKG